MSLLLQHLCLTLHFACALIRCKMELVDLVNYLIVLIIIVIKITVVEKS